MGGAGSGSHAWVILMSTCFPLCPTGTLSIPTLFFSVGKGSGTQRHTTSFFFPCEYENFSNNPHRHLPSYTPRALSLWRAGLSLGIMTMKH